MLPLLNIRFMLQAVPHCALWYEIDTSIAHGNKCYPLCGVRMPTPESSLVLMKMLRLGACVECAPDDYAKSTEWSHKDGRGEGVGCKVRRFPCHKSQHASPPHRLSEVRVTSNACTALQLNHILIETLRRSEGEALTALRGKAEMSTQELGRTRSHAMRPGKPEASLLDDEAGPDENAAGNR